MNNPEDRLQVKFGRLFTAERVRAHAKHDAAGGSMERKDAMDPAWLPVLVEEVGEVARALCEYRHLKPNPSMLMDELFSELVQVGAMVSAWMAAILEDQLRRGDLPCATCGRDNRNGTHSALEGSHLSHKWTPKLP